MDELESALADGDVEPAVMSPLAETGMPIEAPQFFYKLMLPGAEKIGLDPMTLL